MSGRIGHCLGCLGLAIVVPLVLWAAFTIRARIEDRRLGRTLVETGVSHAVWSKNGKALYYIGPDSDERPFTLVRYDVRTRRKTRYEVPTLGFDISPDESSIAYVAEGGLYVHNLLSGSSSRVYPLPGMPAPEAVARWVCWYSDDHILFPVARTADSLDVVAVDLAAHQVSRIPDMNGINVEACASDGSGVVYGDRATRSPVFYSFASGKRTVLDTPELRRPRNVGTFLFVSRSLVVYAKYGATPAEALDLTTGRAHQVPGLHNYLSISPDLARYQHGHDSHGDWYSTPSRLYVYDLPDRTAKLLRRTAREQ